MWRPPARGAWTPDWVRDAVFYEIFPDRFARSGRVPAPGPLEAWDEPPTAAGIKGGDLYGIVERLEELAELGVSALYLTPVFTSASNHRYHTDDYLHVDPLLGGDAALQELLDAAHARGMRVVLDGVFNHTGRGHQPFVHVLENGASSPYRDWYRFDPARLAAARPIEPYGTVDGPGGTFERRGYRAWWDLAALPTLNHANPLVREFLWSVAEHWLRFGIDGWRLDVPQEIVEPGFWEEFRARARRVRDDAYLVGEIWTEAPAWLRGDRFDALMNYPLAEAVLGYVAGRHLDRAVVAEHQEYGRRVRPLDAPAFARALEGILAAYEPAVSAVQLNLLGSHDTPRFRTLCGGDGAAYRLATLLQGTLPGAPCIYYGDELGLEGHGDPDCRRSYPPDPAAGDRGLRDFVRVTMTLRRAHPVLRDGGTFRTVAAVGRSFVHLRLGEEEAFVVGVNAGERRASLRLELPELAGRSLREVGPGADSGARWPVGAEGQLVLDLPARAGRILQSG